MFKKIYFYLFSFILFVFSVSIVMAATMSENTKGKILLQVEQNGEAWYVNPADLNRYYLGRPDDAFTIMRDLGIGITNENLNKIQVAEMNMGGEDTDSDGLSDMFEDALGTDINKTDTDDDGFNDKDEILGGYNPLGSGNLSISQSFANGLKGKILLQVESYGEAWYINPSDAKRYYLGRPDDAFSVMRNLGTGITDANLSEINIKEGYNVTDVNEETEEAIEESEETPEEESEEEISEETLTTADTTKPTIPYGLTAVASGTRAVYLKWSSSTDDVGIYRYDIYRDGQKIFSTPNDYYLNTIGIFPSSEYSYTVASRDEAGNKSAQCEPVTVSTPVEIDTLAPDEPTNFVLEVIDHDRIDLEWAASDDYDLAGFNIYRDGTKIASTQATTYSDTGLASSTTYSYTLESYDDSGNISGQIDYISATTPAD